MCWRILHQSKTNKIIKALLKNRGLMTEKQQTEFLRPKPPEKLTAREVGISPSQLKKAIARIKKAIKNQEKIIVYGDYDTDGVCATAIVWETLHQLKARVMPFIPTREEGYGLKIDRLEKFAREGVKLIITVDQGIVALPQAKKASQLGLDLLITDHHILGEKKPPALAIVHTTRLSGAGVAWFLAKTLGNNCLDLAAIGTVTDVVPLIGPNRSLVKFGLKAVRETKRPGLVSLYQQAGITKEKINTYEVGFIIGPRLNSAGRLEDPMESLRLVCTQDKTRAVGLAEKINRQNSQRQELTNQASLHAKNIWLSEGGGKRLIFISDISYAEGIVGLVASKLVEEFYRPAVVISQGKTTSKGSARSIEEFNIIEAVRTCADILGPHGGHPKAAGFTVKTAKIEVLKKRLLSLAENQLKEEKLTPTLKIDLEIKLEDLNDNFFQQVFQLEPYGEGNPQPVFASRKVIIPSARLVGTEGRHLKLLVKDPASKRSIGAIGFGLGSLLAKISPDKPVDLAYSLLINQWNGQKTLELKVKDIKVL